MTNLLFGRGGRLRALDSAVSWMQRCTLGEKIAGEQQADKASE